MGHEKDSADHTYSATEEGVGLHSFLVYEILHGASNIEGMILRQRRGGKSSQLLEHHLQNSESE